MLDWLYRRRDPAAAGATVLLMAVSFAVWRFTPQRSTTPPQAHEMVVQMEELPPEPPAPPPPAPPPPPPPQTPPPPAPTAPRPAPAPSPQPTPAPAPVAAPAPVSPAPPAPAPPAPVPPAPAPPAPSPPAPAPPPAPAQPTQNPDALYGSRLRAAIDSDKHYPNSREARQLRPVGTVRVWLELDRAGQLLGSGIETGSGSSILDSEGLRTVRLHHYDPIPPEAFAGQATHRFTVAIEFKLSTE